MLDLHRHDEFSAFDGFGKAMDIARAAKAKGHTSLGTSNHGTTGGLVETYIACKEIGIKAVLGVEAYFQPVFDNKSTTRYHLCLFAKNLVGYENINKIMTRASLYQRYYKPVVDFKLLEKYKEGIICTTACVQGFPNQCIVGNNQKMARKALERFKAIYGEDLYVEIQPYAISELGLQEKVNIKMLMLADILDIKCVLTSDSHYINKEDYNTYYKMHQIAGHDEAWLGDTYKERYMPTEQEIIDNFMRMHWRGDYAVEYPMKRAKEMVRNLQEIEDKVEADILDQLQFKFPKMYDEESDKILKQNIMDGLKAKGKYNKEYIDRCKEEYAVIKGLGFEDYFLIVEDYVKWAKNAGIEVGPGRGSVCNCLVAYALDITDVDSLFFNLDFRRFLRIDKKKLPDIDIDFETDRRQEVIDYIVKKYKGHAAQICSYGLYRVSNLLNELFKVCDVQHAEEKTRIKNYINSQMDEEVFDYDSIKSTRECVGLNKQYDNIIAHFAKMYKKVRFIGTHAAGVAISGGNLLDHVALEVRKDKVSTAYDLNNLEIVKAIKFDMLGLRTLSILKELKELTGKIFDYSWFKDKEVLKQFGLGNTDGIFQLERNVAKNILIEMEADCVEDVIAASALDRPGPLSLKMPAKYAENKKNIELAEESPWYEYAKDTYGTIVYQEQIMAICRGIGNLEWADADRLMKMLKGGHITETALKLREKEESELRNKFVTGALSNGKTKEEANYIFDNVIVYSFNKGHATGYFLISFQQMWYKVHHPAFFWYLTLKYAANEESLMRLKIQAVKEGNIILLPHVKYAAKYSIQKLEGDDVLCEGLLNIKNVGEKAAILIEEEKNKNGPFKSYDDFVDRCKGRCITSRVIDSLVEAGALEFDKKIYFMRVKKYNSSLYAR